MGPCPGSSLSPRSASSCASFASFSLFFFLSFIARSSSWCFLGFARGGLGRLGPAAAQGLVELDQRDELLAARAGLAQLRVEQLALRVEHLQVGCQDRKSVV